MFLVKIEKGRKPRVCRVHPHEVIRGSSGTKRLLLSRRVPRAWRPAVAGGEAAIGNTVDEAYELIAQLRGEP
jgi:hypothetical protein